MGLKKKMMLTFISLLSFFIIICNVFIFVILKSELTKEIKMTQRSIIYNNKNTISSFLDSINSVCSLLSGDISFGKVLSNNYKPSELSQYEAREIVTQTFLKSYNVLMPIGNYAYTSKLYLNDILSVSSMFPYIVPEKRTNYAEVYRNTSVKSEDWYQNTINNGYNLNVFLDKEKKQFCIAKRINNAFYNGPTVREGLSVMVVSVDRRQFENVFKLSKVTDNTQLILLNSNNDILYYNHPGNDIPDESINEIIKANKLTDNFTDNQSQTMELNSKKYIVNVSNTKWNIKLVFLTPYSDITNKLNVVITTCILFSIAILVMCAFAVMLASKAITKPIALLSKTMRSIKDSRFVDLEGIDKSHSNDRSHYDEIHELYQSFTTMLNQNNRLINDVEVQTIKQKTSELKALQAQINPHFIYNAMDVVNWIALSRNQDDIADIVETISAIMRYSITNPDEMVHLSDELYNISNYIKIQRLRYKDRVQFSICADKESENYLIPKFVVQPLVENCILHGIRDSITSIEIYVEAECKDGSLTVKISDNGTGCDANKLNDYLADKPTSLQISNGFGIKNIRDRLQLKFGDNSKFFYSTDENNRLVATLVVFPKE